jgi:predicted transcriptional regulator
LQELANDAGVTYPSIARKVNRMMTKGMGLIDSVRQIAKEHGLSETSYKINASKIVKEAEKILREDYTQTLMISAVLGQMVEARGRDRFPAPAFFAFTEILSRIPDAPRDTKSESSTEIEENTTRIIELMTTLVSVLCEWSEKGIIGVAEDCPESLRDMARVVFRKTKLLQGGLWTCISCGEIVNVRDTKALMCANCDKNISRSDIHGRFDHLAGKTRTGYGQTSSEDQED